MTRKMIYAVCSLCLVCGSPLAWAERKPDPAATTLPSDGEPDVAGFAGAYQTAGQPRLLVLCGIDNRIVSDSPQVYQDRGRQATGTDLKSYAGAHVADFSVTGLPQMLAAEIKRYLLQARVELVHADTLAERDTREVVLLALERQWRELQLVGTSINADMLLVVRMIPGQAVEQRGASYRVIVETLQFAGGQQIGSFTFDWQAGQDAVTVKQYAKAVARRFMEDFTAWQDGAKEKAPAFQVRLFGLGDAAELGRLTRELDGEDGVASVTNRGFSQLANRSVATLLVAFDGPNWQLAEMIQRIATEELKRRAVLTDMSLGSITMKMAQGGPGGQGALDLDELAAALMDKDHADHAQAVEQWKKAYAGADSPRIAVLINRAATAEEVNPDSLPATQRSGDGTLSAGQDMIVVMSQPIAGQVAAGQQNAAGAEAAGEDATTDGLTPASGWMNTRRMEDMMLERLRGLGPVLIDPFLARQTVAERLKAKAQADSQNPGEYHLRESELTTLLAQQPGAFDILIHGVGNVTLGPGGQPRSVSYTFRAVRISDGRMLAAKAGTWDLAGVRVGEQGPTQLSQESIAEFVAGQMAAQMLENWTAK
ncbi:MAG: hypothetical protein IT443_07280 [Phycisphaeraceae bacterium]|nr:hypothetical protein [Phycisphaeraceae bacterium]